MKSETTSLTLRTLERIFFSMIDFILPKHNETYGFFGVDNLVHNSLAMADFVNSQPRTKIYWFKTGHDKEPDYGFAKMSVVKLFSIKGLIRLAKCKNIFTTNTIMFDAVRRIGDTPLPINMKKHNVVNYWHGIPIKRILSTVEGWETPPHIKEAIYYKGLVASSDTDSFAMCASFSPINYKNVWVTGSPRSDVLINDYKKLSTYHKKQIDDIRQILNDRKMILYAPTTRMLDKGKPVYKFSKSDIEKLEKLLKKHNAVLAIRPHSSAKPNQVKELNKIIDGKNIIDLSHEKFYDPEHVVRESSVLITDYSSIYFDAMYLSRPVFSFAYDQNEYSNQSGDPGFLYPLNEVFPGDICSTFNALINKIDAELTKPVQTKSEKYNDIKNKFFKYIDDKNSERIFNRVKELNEK